MKRFPDVIDETYPSVLEVNAASAIFLESLASYTERVTLPERNPFHMTRKTAIMCALADVWQQGRRYQRDQNAVELAAIVRDIGQPY